MLSSQGPAEPDADLAAVDDLLVDARCHQVVVADRDPLGREDVADGVAECGDLPGLPVQGQGHGLAEGGVADHAARHGQGHHGHQPGEQDLAPNQLCDPIAHDSPNVVLPGSQVPARPRAPLTQG